MEQTECVHSPVFPDYYQVIRTLGYGQMGVVYLALDKRLDRYVAIKCIKNDIDENKRERLMSEAKHLARLNHPNVVQLYDVFVSDDQVSLIMEYVEGGTFARALAKGEASLESRLHWLIQIAEGLAEVHKAGIIHRDLKGDNVLVDKQGNAKVTDFGIAKNSSLVTHHSHPTESQSTHSQNRHSQNKQSHNKQSQGMAGTLIAMSPEQIQAKPLELKSDLFSFGILAYQALSGQHPFGTVDSPLDVMQNILYARQKPLSQLMAGLPLELNGLIERLLEKNPADRPENCDEVVQILKHASLEFQTTFEYDQTITDFPPIDSSVIEQKSIFSRSDFHRLLHRFNWFKSHVALSMLLLLSVFLIAKVLVDNHSKESIVVVKQPEIVGESTIPEFQKVLIKTAIYQAVTQSILNNEAMHLVSPTEVDSLSSTSATFIGKALGADSVVESRLNCSAVRCEVSISLLKKNKNWAVQAQHHWPILIEDLREVFSITQNQFQKVIPRQKGNPSGGQVLSESDYKQYLSIYNSVLIEGRVEKSMLGDIEHIMQRAEGLPSLYSLYGKICLHLFNESWEQRFLDRLQDKLSLASDSLTNTVELQMIWLELALSQQNRARAEEHYLQIEELGAGQSIMSDLKMRIYLTFGEYAKAIRSAQEVIALRPNAGTLAFLASVYWYSGDFSSAKKTLEELLLLSPNDYYGSELLARVALSEGDIDKVIEAYNTMALRSPKSANYSNLGLAHMLNKEYDTAKIYFAKAVEINPLHADLLLNLADIEQLIGNSDQAERQYRKVINLLSDKEDIESLLTLSQAYAQLGDFEASIKLLNQAKITAPENASVAFTAALIYTLAREKVSSIVAVETALDAGFGTVWFRLAWFDWLCELPRFKNMISDAGDPQRCFR